MFHEREALDYHETGRHGKLQVVPTKPCVTQRDLSLAYTPGVAVPCRHIEKEPDDAYRYTGKGNLVAVVSNGTAVLGLGDIGALAGKPVMEGKGVLFKRFADIDVFDIELDTHDADEIVRTVELLQPTFGGINLEDIKAPECFYIEDKLKERLSIPVFHDDQHGTAIISGAALLNALEIVGKPIGEVRVVFNGAGASGIACARYYLSLGVAPENLVLCDSKGVIYPGRDAGMNPYKAQLANDTGARTLAEALEGADVFVGVSVADCVTPAMLRSMAERPIVFALANPDPEIAYEVAREARPDAILATGRSDYPNQVNNVLGFPFIFRGALDARATAINEEMKLAATRALADLAKEDVPESVTKAYGLDKLHFGPEYLIPKPFDDRVLILESTAVARAAMESGVARRELDLDRYRVELEKRLGKARHVVRIMINRAKRDPKRVVFPEGNGEKVLRAANVIVDEGFAHPILLGDPDDIRRSAADLDLDLAGIEIATPADPVHLERYAAEYFRLRRRKGVTVADARASMTDPNVWGALMVQLGDADAMVCGVGQHFPVAIRPPLEVIGKRPDVALAASVFLMVIGGETYVFADPSVNVDPTADELADIAIMAVEVARRHHIEPRVAMLSFSNFGSARHPHVKKVREATAIVRRRCPELMIDGEMQADVAVVPELIESHYPFSTLRGGATVLVFPDLQSANVAYKLLAKLGGAEAIGPILTGMRKPVHAMQYGCDSRDVVSMAALAVVDAQEMAASEERREEATVTAPA